MRHEPEPDVVEWLTRELEMALVRTLAVAPGVTRSCTAISRTAAELLVSVTEKIARYLELGDQYAAARAEDLEAEAFQRGALQAAKPLWR